MLANANKLRSYFYIYIVFNAVNGGEKLFLDYFFVQNGHYLSQCIQ